MDIFGFYQLNFTSRSTGVCRDVLSFTHLSVSYQVFFKNSISACGESDNLLQLAGMDNFFRDTYNNNFL